ncbi:hypothetical protein M2282_001673 [Variovorax boronicumulans]|uniref:hypothetical protein n=1 Tax=Variovorax boronicumulans TaxID=436515 RepID=UPI002476A60C|nr:hypothetical protein [Variovorax boronicumulans]MDH6166526.1 hypothetical protein [Variovorax boronicumulans]
MPNVRFTASSSFLRALAAGAILFAAGALHAQALPPGVRLGMTADELQAALPAAERVHRPQRLAGGLLGSWRAAPVEMAGLVFEPTFFFAASELRRVEYVATAQAVPDNGASAFGQIVQWGRGVFGDELASRDPGSAYAAWTNGDTDVYVQQVSDPRRASVRLVYKARQLRDGSEL